ncbi:4-(cytidine 5'-diphospho)-2-C-methyl-D-erythritol kinase [Roseicyclus sp.]|uniref:4-(cytidine 5'-diphospho)-2-C-methyl-D-erythritol kinase n=1 Tax=Roseicyclus sp. TaxID=1914329 RepID=UPI003F6B1435
MRHLAPAKVNLALHVTGRRVDGYHLLDSIVVFADAGDWLEIAPAATLSLQVLGPRAAGVPTDRRNLVLQAAALFPAGQGAAITLEKHLPHAGGIGGGSADAAAALRGLAALWDQPLPDMAAVLGLGADLPVCVSGRPSRMAGIGEVLISLPPLPPLWLVLVNAGVAVPTGPVFKGLARTRNPGLPAMPDQGWSDAGGFAAWLARTRNDLEPPARQIVPVIDTVIAAIRDSDDCLLARMSGSGGTCFGLFATEAAAKAAAAALSAAQPDWWVQAAAILP